MGLLYTTPALPALHPPHPSLESIISLNRPAGHVDDYAGALPCLHCGGEKGKPCTYFETLCLCHMSSARSTSDGRGPVTRKRVPDRETPPHPLTCVVTNCMYHSSLIKASSGPFEATSRNSSPVLSPTTQPRPPQHKRHACHQVTNSDIHKRHPQDHQDTSPAL